ncbi:MAG: hypothetical protein ABSB13_04805 [Candidatus Binatus sp.]|jgi:hypothetical protein|uniref:hypothetical protein n=1 Tax=Candidatus Binatus sp. TaxID=2811406 RepID=UPI003D0BDB0D
MRFTLYYDGPLRSAAKQSRLEDKQNIRRILHAQLLQLFRTHPGLPKFSTGRRNVANVSMMPTVIGALSDWADWPKWQWPSEVWPEPWREQDAVTRIGNLHFVPLIRANLGLTCELDILFLRKGRPGSIFGTEGDIDNRLLTLADGLRLPKHEREQAYVIKDSSLSRTSPIFCLLEDDSLITRWNVRADQLLDPVRASNNDNVRLVIDVTTKIANMTWATIPLAGD